MTTDQIINAETGEIEIIKVSAKEIAEREAEGLLIAAEREKYENAKKAILEKLGLTEDEAKLLLS